MSLKLNCRTYKKSVFCPTNCSLALNQSKKHVKIRPLQFLGDLNCETSETNSVYPMYR